MTKYGTISVPSLILGWHVQVALRVSCVVQQPVYHRGTSYTHLQPMHAFFFFQISATLQMYKFHLWQNMIQMHALWNNSNFLKFLDNHLSRM